MPRLATHAAVTHSQLTCQPAPKPISTRTQNRHGEEYCQISNHTLVASKGFNTSHNDFLWQKTTARVFISIATTLALYTKIFVLFLLIHQESHKLSGLKFCRVTENTNPTRQKDCNSKIMSGSKCMACDSHSLSILNVAYLFNNSSLLI